MQALDDDLVHKIPEYSQYIATHIKIRCAQNVYVKEERNTWFACTRFLSLIK